MAVYYDEIEFTELLLHAAERLKGDRAGGHQAEHGPPFPLSSPHVRRYGAVIAGCVGSRTSSTVRRRSNGYRSASGWSPRATPRCARRTSLGASSTDSSRCVPADLTVFPEQERKTIEDVLSQLAGLNDHQWRLTELGETIPYGAALLGARQVSTPTCRRLSHEVAERYGVSVPS